MIVFSEIYEKIANVNEDSVHFSTALTIVATAHSIEIFGNENIPSRFHKKLLLEFNRKIWNTFYQKL